jgi:hypothetical protein
MGVLESIAGDQEEEPGWNRVNSHTFMAMLGQYQRNRISANNALDDFGLSGNARTEVVSWVNGFPRKMAGGGGNSPDVDRGVIHDVLILLENGLMDVATAKIELDWP